MGYKDRPFALNKGAYEALMNEPNYNLNSNQGSVRDFFIENSYGKFKPEFLVVGPYQAQNNLA
jgi:M6 family metalloprotease-like protein